jgi:hypothetical protein
MDERAKRSIYAMLTRSKHRPITKKDVARAPTDRGLYAVACEGVVPYLEIRDWPESSRIEPGRQP